MTTQLNHRRSDSSVPDDLTETLRTTLGDGFLPARGDQILAALMAHHVPGSVLWQLAALPTSRSFDSFADVVASCASQPLSNAGAGWYA